MSEDGCERIAALVGEQGIVICRKSAKVTNTLQKAGFDVLDVGTQVLLAVRPAQTSSLQGRNAFILVSQPLSFFSLLVPPQFSSEVQANDSRPYSKQRIAPVPLASSRIFWPHS